MIKNLIENLKTNRKATLRKRMMESLKRKRSRMTNRLKEMLPNVDVMNRDATTPDACLELETRVTNQAGDRVVIGDHRERESCTHDVTVRHAAAKLLPVVLHLRFVLDIEVPIGVAIETSRLYELISRNEVEF
jgi:hypothetical protein